MGILLKALMYAGRALSYGTTGWALSDIFNEYQNGKQRKELDPSQPDPEPWSIAGSVLGQNWKKYLIGTVILAGVFWLGSIFLKNRK